MEEGAWPPEERLRETSERVLSAAARFLAREEGQPFPAKTGPEVSLVFTSDEDIRSINAEWRGKDTPTNVLSFPAFPLTPGKMPGPMLGDIIFAEETLTREAAELGKPFDAHLAHLMVHGFLHLFGYDHMEDGEAEKMEGIETRILAELGLSDPYGDDPTDSLER